jgi:hypothetical protein
MQNSQIESGAKDTQQISFNQSAALHRSQEETLVNAPPLRTVRQKTFLCGTT